MHRKILIIRGGGLGDTLLALRAVQKLSNHFHPCRITWAGNPAYLPILPLAINLHQTQSTDSREFALLYTHNPTNEEILESFSCNAPFDFSIAWTPKNKTFEQNLDILARQTIRADPHPPTLNPLLHASDYLLTTLLPFGIEASNQIENLPRLQTTKEHRRQACQALSPFGVDPSQKFFLLHPGSGGRKKCWPTSRYIEIGQHLSQKGDVLWITGPADFEILEELRCHDNTISRNILESVPLSVLASVLQYSAGYIGNDSGVTHLAAISRTPIVAIFGPTDPTVWGPQGQDVTILRKNTNCQACFLGSKSAHTCLSSISVENVLKAAEIFN